MPTDERYAAENRRRHKDGLIATATRNHAVRILKSLPRDPDEVIEQRRYVLEAELHACTVERRRATYLHSLIAGAP